VALLVAEATNGEDAELIMAALMHDAIEDQKILPKNIASIFGEKVTALSFRK
jgi:(p)ppGpp synthase/HD superfamily hydrolase